MKKIQSLFKRDYEGNRQVNNEVVAGSEWVLLGEGIATEKYDGTSCMVKDGKLYKRYDAKVSKTAKKRVKREGGIFQRFEFKSPVDGWIPAQDEPDYKTGHWPGWLPVSYTAPEDKYHSIGWERLINEYFPLGSVISSLILEGTYELVGPNIQSNPLNLDHNHLWKHGNTTFDNENEPPRDYDSLKVWLDKWYWIEGVVWHHPDGRMVKIKRKDFGLAWPVK